MEDIKKMSGVDQLRAAVRLFNNCNETFNQKFTPEELMKLWRGYKLCEWDITPDDWTHGQVRRWLMDGDLPTFHYSKHDQVMPGIAAGIEADE